MKKRLEAITKRLSIVIAALTFRWPHLCKYVRKATKTEGIEIKDIQADVSPFELICGLTQCKDDFTLMEKHLKSLQSFVFLDSKEKTTEWNAEPEVVLFLALLTYYIKPKNIIELGSFIGFTSCHIAMILKQLDYGKLFCVEIDKANIDILSNNIRKLELINYVEIIHGSSVDNEVIEKLPKANIIFIDSAHDYATTKLEIEEYSKKIQNPGYLVLHDSIRWPGVRKAISEYYGKKFTFATSNGAGITVLIFE